MKDEFIFYMDVLADDFCELNKQGNFVMKDSIEAENNLNVESKSEKTQPIRKENDYQINDAENNYNSGRWTDEEHERFLEALRIHGKDWEKIQKYVGTRDGVHIRSHAQKFLKKLMRYFNGSR